MMLSRPIEDIHDNFNVDPNQMMRQMENMQKEMFSGFGGGMMMHDPFKNDPFFNGSGGDDMFGNANKMMQQM